MSYAQDKRDFDTNGWFEVKDNPLSKEGVFQYRGSQIRTVDGKSPPDPDKLYWVYRPAEELANKETINSFKLVPWVDNHTMLGKPEIGMTPAEKKGVSGVIGEKVYFKDGVLYGNIKVFSETMARNIESGKRELSLGYRCKYKQENGTYKGQPYDYVQTEIRGNHLALVEDGRMGGDVCVLDSHDENTGHFTFLCNSLTEKEMMTLEEKKELLAKLQAEVEAEEKQQQEASDSELETDEADSSNNAEDNEHEPESHDVLSRILDVIESLAARVDKLETPQATDEVEGGEEQTSEDEDEEDGKGEETQAMDAAAIAKDTMKRIDARNALHKRVVPHVGQFDCSAMDESDVASYACRKLNLKPTKGQELAMLNGFLAARKADSQKKMVTHGAVAMDSRDKGKNNFITKQLNK